MSTHAPTQEANKKSADRRNYSDFYWTDLNPPDILQETFAPPRCEKISCGLKNCSFLNTRSLTAVRAMVVLPYIVMVVGLLLSIFYKKSFTFRDEGLKDITLTVSAVFLHIIAVYIEDAFGIAGKIFSFGLMAFMFFETFYKMDWSERIKAVIISVTILICRIRSRETLGICAAVVAISQFLRKPNSLKNALSTSRIMLGPVYFLLMAGAGMQFIDSQKICNSALSLTTAFSPLVAATFFRPDNFELLKVICPNCFYIIRPPRIRSIHGLLMFYSLLAITLNSLWPTPARCIAATDLILYILFSDFPKKLRKLAISYSTRIFSIFNRIWLNSVE